MVAGLHRAVVERGPGSETQAVRAVRIDDLREPQRDAGEQAFFDVACAMAVDLDPEQLVAQARAETGLSDFGDETLLDRLAAQVAAIEADRGLSGLGRFIVRATTGRAPRALDCASRTSCAGTRRRSRSSSSRRSSSSGSRARAPPTS